MAIWIAIIIASVIAILFISFIISFIISYNICCIFRPNYSNSSFINNFIITLISAWIIPLISFYNYLYVIVTSLSQLYILGDMAILMGHLWKLCFGVTKISFSILLNDQISNSSCCNNKTPILNCPDMSLLGWQYITSEPV